VLAAVLSLCAGAWAVLPKLLAPKPIPVPITIQVPEPPPPPAPPVPAPEPVIEPVVQAPPEPMKPAKAVPKGPKALLAQAGKLLENGDAEAALELYGRVASEDPSNSGAQAGRGLCYLDLENYAPAEASFLAALGVDPEHPDALLGLAETYRFQGKKAEAISHYEKYLARHPDGEDAEVAKHALAELRN
jgi:tetratricopeptide (TPR) repeat protein